MLTIYLAKTDASVDLSLKELIKGACYKIVAEADLFKDALYDTSALSPDVVILYLSSKVRDFELNGSTKTINYKDVLGRLTAALNAPAVVVLDGNHFSGAKHACALYGAGALSCLTTPVRLEDFKSAVEFSVMTHKEVRGLKAENRELRKENSGRIAVERAKGLLMEAHGITEHNAFSRIRKMSMDTRRPLDEVASMIIHTLNKSA